MTGHTIYTISVAKDFSKYPGGRYTSDGDYSGERFRHDFLVPALKASQKVVVELDGTLGYGSSFLEEAFGGLVREEGFSSDILSKQLEIVSNSGVTKRSIERYIKEAKPK